MTHKGWLRNQKACRKGRAFARRYDTMAEAWRAYQRLDWMRWLLGRATEVATMKGREDVAVELAAITRQVDVCEPRNGFRKPDQLAMRRFLKLRLPNGPTLL